MLMTPLNARKAAYIALCKALKKEQFLSETLQEWHEKEKPSSSDFHLAQQIAYGTFQKWKSLDYLAKQLNAPRPLKLKLKERALVNLALYQALYLERVPLYAICDEMVSLAKEETHSSFANFLNALLRKIPATQLKLPEGMDPESLSIRYSYPLFFVTELLKKYALEKTEHILDEGNTPPKIMVRLRSLPENFCANSEIFHSPFSVGSFQFATLTQPSFLEKIATSKDFYIQNATPAFLINFCAQHSLLNSPPQMIVDLCASPGGKLLAAHDLFPLAKLYANDLSPQKIAKLGQNLQKYALQAPITMGEGQSYPLENKFDIVILDVPCSNSGVLNKRPEARWRLESDVLDKLKVTQYELLKRAASLLNERGEIWYLTCSILPQENELFLESVASELSLKILETHLQLPQDSWDGGFAAILTKTS